LSVKNRKKEKLQAKEKLQKKQAYKKLLTSFKPLIIAVLLWFVSIMIIHLPAIKEEVAHFFIKFTLDSAVGFCKMLFLPVESYSFPNITVSGYTMKIVMECTAYNFYIFVIYLSLLSPVKWKQKLYTLIIFLVAVFIVNNLRFITVGYVGKYSETMFHYVHDYLWNILFGFMIFLIWAWRYKNTLDINTENELPKKVD